MGMPDRVTPVQSFDADRYLGTWYEIARLDHSFERDLKNVSATYARREDGGLRVLNRGQSLRDGQWSEAEGKAYFVNRPDEAYLKVSFWGPFYASYVVFELDQADYHYAFISGNSTDYLWLLSRTPTVSPEIKAAFVKQSAARGFPVERLIWVEQSTSQAPPEVK